MHLVVLFRSHHCPLYMSCPLFACLSLCLSVCAIQALNSNTKGIDNYNDMKIFRGW